MRKLLGAFLLLLMPVVANAQYSQGGGSTFTGGTLTSPLLIPDGTVAAPGIAGANYSNWGLYFTAGPILNLSAGNNRTMFWTGSLMGFNKTYQLCWYTAAFAAQETCLTDSAAAVNDTLELRRGTNPNTFNIYNTYTDASNYERGTLKWSGNTFNINTEKLGSGSIRDIYIGDNSQGVFLSVSGGAGVKATGNNFVPLTGDSMSLGEISASRYWQYLYLSRSIQGSKTKTLTDAAAAASFVRIAVPTNGFAAGSVIYTATSTDGTNILVTSGTCNFAAADTAGTVTAGTPTCDTPSTAYKRANTLVCTISGAVSTTNYDLQATCTDNLAGSQTVTLYYRLDMPQPNTVTPQ